MNSWDHWRTRLRAVAPETSPSEQVIRRLYEIAARHPEGFPAQMRALLTLGAERFDLEIAILAQVVGDQYLVVHVVAPPEMGLADGDVFPFGSTYCSITLGSEGPVGFEHAGQSPIQSHPAYGAFGLEAYLGAPVIVDGEVFGTLNFSSPLPRRRHFDAADVDSLRLMAAWVGAELERRRAEAAQLTRNEELRSFCYTLTHDLRQPLNAIVGGVDLLLSEEGGGIEEGGPEILETLRHAARTMAQRIDALLALYELSQRAPARAPVDLGALAREVVQELRQTEPERRVELVVQPDLLLTGDPALIRSIVSNLVGNAWKFTQGVDDACITVGRTVRGEERCFFVRDNGVGFDMDMAEHIFEPFRRAHGDAFRGTGIGLSTVRRIVAMHHGHVWAESAPGHGATFYFTIE